MHKLLIFQNGIALVNKMAWVIIFASILVATSLPAFAVESWDCKFVSQYGSDKGLGGISRIRIENNVMDWLLPPWGKPYPGMKWTKTEDRLLENNKIGMVSVSSYARVYRPVGAMYRGLGPIIGATVTTLDKKSGNLRVGSVMRTGEYDLLTGHCARSGEKPTRK